MSDKPTAAFALSLAAGIFVFLGALLYIALGTIMRSLLESLGFGGIPSGFLVLFGVIGLVWSAAIIGSAFLICSGDPGKVKTGAVLVFVFSVFSWFGSVGGIFIGFILGLAGAI